MKSSNFHQVLWLSIGQFFTLALGFVSAAILSRYFDKAEYGTYKQILYVYTTLVMIFTAGLPAVFSYFIPRFSMGQGKRLVNKITYIFLILGAAFSLLLFFGADVLAGILKNPELAIGIKIFSPFPLFTLPTMGVEGIYTALRKTKYIAIYQAINKILMLLCIVLPVILFNGTYRSAIIGWGVASLITFIIAMYMKNKPYVGVREEFIPNMYKTIFAYSLPLLGASCVGMLIYAADQFFISHYFGTAVFAEFSNGFIALPFVGMITGPVRAVLLPIFSKASVDQQMDDALKSYRIAVQKSAVLLYPVLLFCVFFAEDIMEFLYGTQYIVSSKYFQIALIKYFFDLFPILVVLLGIGKSNIYFYVHLFFAIVIWVFEYLAILLFQSPIAVAIVSVFMFVMLLIAFFVYLSKVSDINLISFDILKELGVIILHSTVVAGGVYGLSQYFMPDLTPFFKLFLAGIIFYGILVLSGRIIKINYIESFSMTIKRQ